ncbi:ABC transporter ATP-binding protein [Azospirillum sp. RWY-5-1]|uniref:ABC transporter ATP-binding protein n=1 Tax=Azospirillum oleiclasticum TaxID=2735135 RepID=A0ABX2T626_9PROT|nr:ABC transporter ATP-binding protein [Azospirillum oleiclasticum]NYZ12612.1 ABC transporter ATP-binding protein [Azospirillum oleiclasticum]NYZ19772.1 ABC transporter ATP-binding protein [Azospirillum oleiclasticum]
MSFLQSLTRFRTEPAGTSATGAATAIDADAASPLSVRGLSVAYHHKPVLWSIDYTAPPRGLVAVIGPNGAGKSTFIKACLGLVPALSGEVRVFGRPVAAMRGEIGYMPQRGSVDWDFPVSALDVVAMGRYGRIGMLRPVRRADRERALACLEMVGLADFAGRQIGQLSGGQQQRVFLARALAQEARLYFMDEPFAGVDAATERAILDVLHTLDRQGRTVICVHHDLQTVTDRFHHALVLNVEKIADGPVARTVTEETLARAYATARQDGDPRLLSFPARRAGAAE